MKSLRIFTFLFLLAFSFGSFQLTAAPKTLDEINAEREKKEEEEKKKEKETRHIKAEKTKEKRNLPAKKENPASSPVKKYTVIEDIIGFPRPFETPTINNSDLMNADPKAVELFEQASKKEKNKDSVKNPAKMISLWQELVTITENNPFAGIAQERISEWDSAMAILNRHQENLDKISKLIPANMIAADQKVSLVTQHLDEYGIMFGTEEILKISKESKAAAEIAKNEVFKNKIAEIITARCEKQSGKDCFSIAKFFSKNESEKISYLTKACHLNYNDGCKEENRIKVAAAAEKARIAAEEKRKAEKEKIRQQKERETNFKRELDQAGRKKRITIASTLFVPGIIITALGGVSFYGMNKAEKERKKNYQSYLQATDNISASKYRKKADDAEKNRSAYMVLGSIGIVAGTAMMATGIAFYSIEFEGEKAVKKKYNVSFGASPFDGTLQFALRW